ncbi:MAG: hypothetical protein AAFP81_17485 [Pseudomonadota bacterium]
MTVLSAIQQACTVIGLEKPDSVFGSTEREHVELADLANEIGERIAKAAEWRVLAAVETITGDAVTTAWPLPADYDRMTKDSKVWLSTYQTPATRISSLDDWLEREVREIDFLYNAWIIFGGNMNIKPELAVGATAKFYYQQNTFVRASDNTRKAAFDNDGDSFMLDERMLRLGIIWQWKETKGLPYAEDMTNFEMLQSKRIAEDAGAKEIKMGRVRLPRGVENAYPFSISES